jgi:hypothetical protein
MKISVFYLKNFILMPGKVTLIVSKIQLVVSTTSSSMII